MSDLGNVQRSLEQLSDLTRTTDKIDFLKEHEDQPLLKEVLLYALNPYKKYYITKVASTNKERPPEGTKEWEHVHTLLDKLSNRWVTGKNAQQAVEKLANKLAPAEYKVLVKILNKDLRCGVGAVLVNKVWPEFIPTFGVMLCTPLETHHIKKFFKHRCYHQAKKNGDRCVVICRYGGEPEVLSRKGYPMLNYTAIAEALQAVADDQHISLVFDGEVIVGDFFNTRNTKKLAGNEAEGAVFHCFDMVQLDQWESGSTDSFHKRLAELRGVSKSEVWVSHPCLQRVPTYVLKADDISMEGLDGLRDAYKAQGDEGLIVRIDEGYNFTTRSSCYKHKAWDTMDCTILEILLGEEGKKHEHHAGAMMVELDNGQECKAGLRASMKVRDDLWNRRGEIVGLTAEIQYQDKTVNKSGEYKLQFPTWTGVFREDKS